MAETTKSRETYEVHVACDNCRNGYLVGTRLEIPKGETVSSQPCPKCGVRELRLV